MVCENRNRSLFSCLQVNLQENEYLDPILEAINTVSRFGTSLQQNCMSQQPGSKWSVITKICSDVVPMSHMQNIREKERGPRIKKQLNHPNHECLTSSRDS